MTYDVADETMNIITDTARKEDQKETEDEDSNIEHGQQELVDEEDEAQQLHHQPSQPEVHPVEEDSELSQHDDQNQSTNYNNEEE